MAGSQIVQKLVKALNTMDSEGFASIMADDVVVEHVSTGRKIIGKAEVVSWFSAMLEVTERNDVEIKRMCEDGSTIWVERVDRHLIDGNWVEIPIMGIMELDSQGKLRLMRDYFDSKLAL